MKNDSKFRETPILETPRLKLRAHRLEDFEACAAMWRDPIVTRYTIGQPSTEQRTWLRLLGYRGHWDVLGYGYWAVEEKSTGRYIGEMGFADFKREIQPSLHGIPELGWALMPSAHGKGYATEGLKAATAWADGNFKVLRTACIINPNNFPSLRVAEKLGYMKFAETTLSGTPEILFFRELI